MAPAAPIPAQTFAGGFGNDSCGLWTKERLDLHGPIAMGQMAWVLGYLSGISLGRGKGDLLKGMDTEAIFGWMDKFCRQNPLSKIANAVVELSVILRK